jgi:hypothetical protein
MFFTPSASGRCSDSTRVQHAEGSCNPISNLEMECVISVFSKDNLILETRDGRAISGQVVLKRK